VRHLPTGSEGDRVHDALRVIVADDDPLARRVVRDALERDGVTVIAEAGTGREAVELGLYYKPDVVVMDLVMPGIDGMEATRRIREGSPDTEVVILTASESEELGLRALHAGACGFLSKSVDMGSLPRALRGAAAGEAVISRRLAMRMVRSMRRLPPDGVGTRPVRSPLTPREWEVLDLLCTGESTYGIAEKLVLSTATVRSHITNLQRKLGVSSREEAIDAAKRMRVEPDPGEERRVLAS
jgi:DNA-binding NarL/FixJ family response regulator